MTVFDFIRCCWNGHKYAGGNNAPPCRNEFLGSCVKIMRFVHLRDSCLVRTSCLVPPDLSSFLPLLFVGCATWISRAGITTVNGIIYSKAELIVVCFHMFFSSLWRFRIDRNASRSEQFLKIYSFWGIPSASRFLSSTQNVTWHWAGL